MHKSMRTYIKGSGHCLPGNIVDNKELVSKMNTSEQFILERTGVQLRHHVNTHESLKDLMIPAFNLALKNASLESDDIDMLIVNTISPDHHDPSQSCFIQPFLNLRNIPSFDIKAQCSGLIYGIDIADQFIRSGKHNNIAIICGEVLSKRMDYSDEGRNLSILLGDGAGVLIVGNNKQNQNKGFIDIETGSDGEFYKLLWTESPGSWQGKYNNGEGTDQFRMTGKEMFEHASNTLISVASSILSRNGLTIKDVDVIIPHQPNMRILDRVANVLNTGDKMIVNVNKFGNMASGSLPVTYSVAMNEGLIPEGSLCLFLGYGSGATWGAALFRN